ncbi:uncharacterized protein LOC124452900 [Xenia sp. Carnegie-2017]|uniref:uncharacterized protein LOC124452900 n=1 Tax=Xenia sp. Carnegie-2017 TaxID=2897299 RepID=UPI001F04E938|nr:uncharacterized protein LOC124452900 [Xenia sp. Carnegie-2017]
MNIRFTIVTLALLVLFTDAAVVRNKRSFKSYFENYLDEMATSACAGMAKKTGVYMGVRRACTSGATCKRICQSLKLLGRLPGGTRNSDCVESFHVYERQPSLADSKLSDTDVNKIGQAIYRYKSCYANGCGPNYCCCRGYY